MNGRILAFLLLCLAGPAFSQGFAGLGVGDVEGFAQPVQGQPLRFPADHGAHPDFRVEWWYVTANLTDASGRDFGVQWTLFRSALSPDNTSGWQNPQVWMGHAAVTSAQVHFSAEKLARGGIGQAGAQAQPFEAWIDDWAMTGDPDGALSLTASGADFRYALNLTAQGPRVLQGDGGYSVKSASGQASYYYSQPFYAVEGQLMLPEGAVSVTGRAWLDREWASQPLDPDQGGWDWISLHLDDGAKLIGFQVRDTRGGVFTSGTWIAPDGQAIPFGNGALRLTPLGRGTPPTRWRVELPAQDVDVQIDAINRDAWMPMLFPYWEGPVRLSGSHAGRGYLEMTGYD